MAGADEAGPSRVKEAAPAPTRLEKSDRIVRSAFSLRHYVTGNIPATVHLIHRGPGAPLKPSNTSTDAPAAAEKEQPTATEQVQYEPESANDEQLVAGAAQKQAEGEAQLGEALDAAQPTQNWGKILGPIKFAI